MELAVLKNEVISPRLLPSFVGLTCTMHLFSYLDMACLRSVCHRGAGFVLFLYLHVTTSGIIRDRICIANGDRPVRCICVSWLTKINIHVDNHTPVYGITNNAYETHAAMAASRGNSFGARRQLHTYVLLYKHGSKNPNTHVTQGPSCGF